MPSGTVTFFLTDIEGSTWLWERFPDQMQSAIIRHDALLHQAIDDAGGIVLKHRGEGDSFIGREQELAQVKQWLEEARLVTLTGLGGCGKTRLSLPKLDKLPLGGAALCRRCPPARRCVCSSSARPLPDGSRWRRRSACARGTDWPVLKC